MNIQKTGDSHFTGIILISIFVIFLALVAAAVKFPIDDTKSKATILTTETMPTTIVDVPVSETIVYRVHYINNQGKNVSNDVLTFILPNGSICQRTLGATSVFQCGGASTYVE